jgi:hypothetical protein
MVVSTILALVFATARAAHGGGYVSRLLSILIMGLAFFLIRLSEFGLNHAAIQAAICLAGLMAGLIVGWGKGFAAITGRYFDKERDFMPADYVGHKVYVRTGDAKLAGIAFLTVRSMFFLPLFIALAAFTGDYYGYLLSSLFVFSMGIVYYGAGRLVSEDKAVRLAEIVYFAIIGAALA